MKKQILILSSFIAILMLLINPACKKDKIALPTIQTNLVSNVNSSSASCDGTIISIGGGPISVSGICWSINHNPTINDSKTINGPTTAVGFTSFMLNLNSNTTYYVRAYATNKGGTAYGSELEFTTTQKL